VGDEVNDKVSDEVNDKVSDEVSDEVQSARLVRSRVGAS